MGILDKIFRRSKQKVIGEEARYILKKQGKGGGMTKVSELTEPTTIEELYESLSPGIYSLHKYKKGQTGFEVVWGPVEVLGEAEAATTIATTPRRNMFSGMREMAEDITAMKEDMTVFMGVFGPIFGYGKPEEGKERKTIFEEIKEARGMQKDLNEIFPLASTGGGVGASTIPVSGSIPAIAVYLPQVIDESMGRIEQRLQRWGLIGETNPLEGEGREIIKLPEKPKMKSTEGKINLPEKGEKEEKKGDIKESDLGEDKK